MFLLSSLNAAFIAGRRADCIVSDFPEYATDVSQLSGSQVGQIRGLASSVYATLWTQMPVRGVVVVGHADVALRVDASQRAGFEMDVSLKRAQSGRELFQAELASRAGSRSITYMVLCKVLAMGSANRIILHPQNEKDMRRNRRVEFFLVTENAGAPNCGCVA
jgi:hypothetical protein